MFTWRKLCFILLIILFSLGHAAPDISVYVDPTVSTSGDGSQNAPFKSFTDALSVLITGSVLTYQNPEIIVLSTTQPVLLPTLTITGPSSSSLTIRSEATISVGASFVKTDCQSLPILQISASTQASISDLAVIKLEGLNIQPLSSSSSFYMNFANIATLTLSNLCVLENGINSALPTIIQSSSIQNLVLQSIFLSKIFPSAFVTSNSPSISMQNIQILQESMDLSAASNTSIFNFTASTISSNISIEQILLQTSTTSDVTSQLQIMSVEGYNSLNISNLTFSEGSINARTDVFTVARTQSVYLTNIILSDLEIDSNGSALFTLNNISYVAVDSVKISGLISLADIELVDEMGIEFINFYIFEMKNFITNVNNSFVANLTVSDSTLDYITVLFVTGDFYNFNLRDFELRRTQFRYKTFSIEKEYHYDSMVYDYVPPTTWITENFVIDNCTFLDGKFMSYAYIDDNALANVLLINEPDIVIIRNISISNSILRKDPEGTVTYYSYLFFSLGYRFDVREFNFVNNTLEEYIVIYLADRLASLLVSNSVFMDLTLQNSILLMMNYAGLQVPLITFAYFDVVNFIIYPQYIVMLFSNSVMKNIKLTTLTTESSAISISAPFFFIDASHFENVSTHNARLINSGSFNPIPTDTVYTTYARNDTFEHMLFPDHPGIHSLFDNSTYDADASGYALAYQFRFRNNTFLNNKVSGTYTFILIERVDQKATGIIIDGNTFNGTDLGAELDSNLIWLIFTGHVEMKDNTFTNGQGKGYMLKIDAMTFPSFVNVSNNTISAYHASGFLTENPQTIETFVFQDNKVLNSVFYITFLQVLAVTNTGTILLQRNSFSDTEVYSSFFSSYRICMIYVEVQTAMNTSHVRFLHNSLQNITYFKTDPYIKGNFDNSLVVFAVGSSMVEISDCVFNLTAVRDDGCYLSVSARMVRISRIVMQNISTTDWRGPMFLLSSNIAIDSSNFSYMHGFGTADGGIMYVENDPYFENGTVAIEITNNNFVANSVTDGYGGILYTIRNTLKLRMENNTFIDNYSKGGTGAFHFEWVEFLDLAITNNTFIVSNYSTVFPTQDWIHFISCKGEGRIDNLQVFIEGDLSLQMISVVISPSFFLSMNNVTVYQKSPISVPADGVSRGKHFSLINSNSGEFNLSNLNISNAILSKEPIINLKCANKTNKVSLSSSTFSNITQRGPSVGVYSSLVNRTESLQIATTGGIFSTDPLDSVAGCQTSIIITQANFRDIVQDGSGGIINDLSPGATKMKLSYSNFLGNKAGQGGVISTFSPDINSTIEIVNCSFIDNQVSGYGGVIFNFAADLDISNSSFINNTANYSGGAIFSYYLGDPDKITKQSNNSFIGNTFLVKGGHDLGARPHILSIDFTDDSYNKTGMKKSYLNSTLHITNFTSYTLQDAMFKILIFDEIGQPIQDISVNPKPTLYFTVVNDKGNKTFTSDNCTIAACTVQNCTNMLSESGANNSTANGKSANQTEIIGITTACYVNDKNIQLNGFGDSNVTQIYIVYRSRDIVLNSSITVQTRDCIPGEVSNTKDLTCEWCPYGKYSLHPTDTYCKPCPTGASCNGGYFVELLPGYWRNSTTSDIIMACNDSSTRCAGTYDSVCKEGFVGPLCHQCDLYNGYVRQGSVTSMSCGKCPSDTQTYLLTLMYILGMFIYQLYFVRVSITTNRQYYKAVQENLPNPTSTGPYIRGITTYLQIITIVSSFNAGFENYFGIHSSDSGTSDLFYSHDCLFVSLGIQPENQLRAKVVFNLLLPIIKLLVIYLIWTIRWRGTFTQKRKIRLFIIAISFFVLEQPGIVQTLISYSSCSKLLLDSSAYYVYGNEFFKCGTDDYQSFYYWVVVPFFCVYFWILPLILFLILYSHRNNLNGETIRIAMGTLYNEFTPKAYYWGMIIIAFKLLLIVLNNLLMHDIKTKASVLFLVMYAYKVFLEYKAPYYDANLMKAETFTIFAYLATVFCSYLFINNEFYIQTMCLILMLLANGVAVGFIGRKVFEISRETVLQQIKKIRGSVFNEKNPGLECSSPETTAPNNVDENEKDLSSLKIRAISVEL